MVKKKKDDGDWAFIDRKFNYGFTQTIIQHQDDLLKALSPIQKEKAAANLALLHNEVVENTINELKHFNADEDQIDTLKGQLKAFSLLMFMLSK